MILIPNCSCWDQTAVQFYISLSSLMFIRAIRINNINTWLFQSIYACFFYLPPCPRPGTGDTFCSCTVTQKFCHFAKFLTNTPTQLPYYPKFNMCQPYAFISNVHHCPFNKILIIVFWPESINVCQFIGVIVKAYYCPINYITITWSGQVISP